MTGPENETAPLWPSPRRARRSRWLVPTVALGALALVAATALTTWTLTRRGSDTSAGPAGSGSPTPTATQSEREQHARDTMTSGEERDWLENYDLFDNDADRTAALGQVWGDLLAGEGLTIDDVEAFAPGFCASVEQVGAATALTAAMLEPDPDNPGMLIPTEGKPALLAVYAVRGYCPWFVAEFDNAIT